jgi:glycosyltransferase involved in cell wall biosynthesis
LEWQRINSNKSYCNANWIKELHKVRFNREAHVIPSGLDLQSLDTREEFIKCANKKVLMVYRVPEWKGCKDGFEAFKIVKRRYKNVELVMFGFAQKPIP